MIHKEDLVVKKSGKPFKSKKLVEKVISFSINQTDPKGRECVVFADGSVCNTDLLEKLTIIDKRIVDNVKLLSLSDQVIFLLNVLDFMESTTFDVNGKSLIEFKDLLSDIMFVNRNCSSRNEDGTFITTNENFIQVRVDGVLKLRKERELENK